MKFQFSEVVLDAVGKCGCPTIKLWVLHPERTELHFTSGYKSEAFAHVCGPRLDIKKEKADGCGHRLASADGGNWDRCKALHETSYNSFSYVLDKIHLLMELLKMEI